VSNNNFFLTIFMKILQLIYIFCIKYFFYIYAVIFLDIYIYIYIYIYIFKIFYEIIISYNLNLKMVMFIKFFSFNLCFTCLRLCLIVFSFFEWF